MIDSGIAVNRGDGWVQLGGLIFAVESKVAQIEAEVSKVKVRTPE
jgi:hypothetical protein